MELNAAMATVHQLNASDGGVPKLPIRNATVTDRGFTVDRQADTQYHGSPDQALCLYSLEVISTLQAEGHPIAPGSAGENVTISGLDWAALGAGDVLELGGDVVAELTFPAVPCRKNAGWFVDGDFLRMSESRHPGFSRWYARVLRGGDLRPGDPVVLRAAD